MASYRGNDSEDFNSTGVDAEPKPQTRTTEKPKKNTNTKINIGSVKYAAIHSPMNVNKKIQAEKQKGKKALGIFWDIQNCSVPKGKSVPHLIASIKKRFLTDDHTLKEFMCVCDTSRESQTMLEDLTKGVVKVEHVPANLKNSADDEIKHNLKHFADAYPDGSTLVLISSDIDYAKDLAYIKDNKKLEVILVHEEKVNSALKSHASQTVLYTELTNGLPDRDGYIVDEDIVLVVTGYKCTKDFKEQQVREILGSIIQRWQASIVNCAGKFSIIKVSDLQMANEMKDTLNNKEVNGQKLLFKLLEDSEHKNNIYNMMTKNRKGGGDSEIKNDNLKGGNPRKNQKSISTDHQGQQIQTLVSEAVALQIVEKETRGQFILGQAGIFWDMETCPLPINSTVQEVIKAIRDKWIDDNFAEAELISFCNVSEAGDTLKQLEKYKITTVHTFMDAAPVIQRSLMKFADLFPPRSRIILISNNAAFLLVLDHYKKAKKFQTFLIHANIEIAELAGSLSECFTLKEIIAKDDGASADNA